MNETRFCGACGQSNSVDARFCGKCGTTLTPLHAAPAAPAPIAAAAPAPSLAGGANKTLTAASIDPQALAAHVAQIQAAQPQPQAFPQAFAPEPQAPRTATYEPVREQRPLPPAPVAPAALPMNPARGMQTMMGVALDAGALPPAAASPRPRVQYATMIDPPREASSFDAAHAPNALPPAPVAPVASAPIAPAPVAPVASAPIAPAPVAPAAAPSKPAMRTMMGMAAFDPATLGSPDTSAAPPVASVTPTLPSAPVAPLPPAPIASQHADARSSRPRDQIMKTMLTASLAAPVVAATPEAAAPAATHETEAPAATPAVVTTPDPLPEAPMSHRKEPIKTMMGMAFPGLPPAGIAAIPEPSPIVSSPVNPIGPTEAVATPMADAAPTEVAPAPSVARKQLGPSNRTMLGVLAPQSAIDAAVAAAEARDAAQSAPVAPPTAPTMTAPAAMNPVPYSSAHAPDALPTGDMSIAGMPSPRRRTNALLIVVLLLGALLVAGAGAAFVMFGMGSARVVNVTPTHIETGEVLRVTVPELGEGFRARFAGTELPLTGGTADFPLAADALHVGDNALSIDLVGPGGEVETHQVTLTLNYRVRADLTSLTAAPAAITIVVEAAAGSTVVVDGESLALDPSGRASHAAPTEGMAASADGMIEYVAHYAITPLGGAATEGTLTTRVPLTTLHLDRPGDDVVTDQSTLDIAGVVPEGASLTIDGAAITVLPGGRFLHRYPMPAIGEFSPRLVASAPNFAPRSHPLHIRRVADLGREAASFTYDRAITYARMGPAPTSFTGQRVMFEGRVYNVEMHDGRGVLQMLVRDCPASERCPLWVSYAVTTDITVDSWVRIYGTVEGEQEFRSATGENRTVPSVQATFILPARP
jgi:hypothetical protein